jgi:hypothetical protein
VIGDSEHVLDRDDRRAIELQHRTIAERSIAALAAMRP